MYDFSRKMFLMLYSMNEQNSLEKWFSCYVLSMTKLHYLIPFTSWDIGKFVYCSCLFLRLWRHEFINYPHRFNQTVFLTLARRHGTSQDISVRSQIGRDVAGHAETSSQRCKRYVKETDLFETSLWRLIGTWKKLTYLRRHNDVPIDT